MPSNTLNPLPRPRVWLQPLGGQRSWDTAVVLADALAASEIPAKTPRPEPSLGEGKTHEIGRQVNSFLPTHVWLVLGAEADAEPVQGPLSFLLLPLIYRSGEERVRIFLPSSINDERFLEDFFGVIDEVEARYVYYRTSTLHALGAAQADLLELMVAQRPELLVSPFGDGGTPPHKIRTTIMDE